ncbi:MAG: NTP transferase domain-containing protein [Actinobacteria bacterium]|nr:NTP transferase domain-containing protein [Actinomycetota bacterium]
MNVEVAVVPAAGRGTRMMDATRVVPKALLPVIDRPALQWVLQEAVAGGAVELIVVVSPGVDDLIFSHFEGMGGVDRIGDLRDVRIRWVVQERPLGLGDAVLRAREAVAGRPFHCLLGDNIMPPGVPCLGPMATASDGRSVVALREMTAAETSAYGVAELGEWLDESVVEIVGAVEKPGPEAAPSHLGFLGRYLFTPEVFDLLEELEPGYGGEVQLTDAIRMLAEGGRCLGAVIDAAPLDVGNPASYLEAITLLGLQHPATATRYRAFIESVIAGG